MRVLAKAWMIAGMVASIAACGPMPGYVPDEPEDRAPRERPAPPDEREHAPDPRDEGAGEHEDDAPPAVGPGSSVEYGDDTRDTPAGPPASPAARRPAVDAPPAPAPAVETSRGGLQTIPLGDPKTYYLIDRNRGLCFLFHNDSMTEIDCAKIPEARDLVPAAAPAPAAPTPPAPAPPAPAPPAVRRGPGVPTPSTRNDGPPPARVAPVVPSGSPTPDELVRFEAAYIDIFCDRRGGATTPPKMRIEQQGLSVERYGDIEEWWASDQTAWWSLVNKARSACDTGK